ncbi:sensor histidine kinase [Spirosoma agri]|uniref:histidine kinase n=1 Tax=Spirosoma agri TaxID=1987381 RepID=A0A6M0IQS3_9BACT|nr:ATP-binding protein [Spirosoma agri]NEU70646.1 PAS domain-containing protein [Spirosoma agri]
MSEHVDADTALEIERLQLALQAAHVGTWDYNLVTNYALWSPICKQLFGLSPTSTVSAAVLLDQVHPDDKERVAQANARILSPQSDGNHNVIFRTINGPDTYRWVQAKGRTIINQQGRIVRFSGIVIDITELKQAQETIRQSADVLEQRVLERTKALNEANQQLKKSNENLEEFAYIASHDLQEPLRKIQTFGDLLNEKYAPHLGEGVAYLERMQTAARRMSNLIKDLLMFSRISSRQRATMSVGLTELVQFVLQDLEMTIEDTKATIHVDPLPTVQGDQSQLAQLFLNLLSNAIKFHRAGVTPLITVKATVVNATELPVSVWPARVVDSYNCIEVSDNGIGFDEKYLDRIFQVFQRLHGKSEYAGTGIGLAICEKVTATHGGAITAKSQLGQGTTFCIYLPV